MKCYSLLVYLIAILFIIEGYDAGSPTWKSPARKKSKVPDATNIPPADTTTQASTSAANSNTPKPFKMRLSVSLFSNGTDWHGPSSFNAGGYGTNVDNTPGPGSTKGGSPNSLIPVQGTKGPTENNAPGQSGGTYRPNPGGSPMKTDITPGSSPRKDGSPNSRIPVRDTNGPTENKVPGQSGGTYRPKPGGSPMKIDITPGSSPRKDGSPNSKIPIRKIENPTENRVPGQSDGTKGSPIKTDIAPGSSPRKDGRPPKYPVQGNKGQTGNNVREQSGKTTGNGQLADGSVPEKPQVDSTKLRPDSTDYRSRKSPYYLRPSPRQCDIQKYEDIVNKIIKRIIIDPATEKQKVCKGGKLYAIGYYPKSNSPPKKPPFVRVLEVCYDENLRHPIYSHAKIVPGSKKDYTQGRYFVGLHMYPVTEMKKAYEIKNQRQTIEKILGSKELMEQLLKSSGQFFLARGHLIAKNDVVGINEQRATNSYINVVPIWQNINAGKWKVMEDRVRELNEDKDFELEVWTGSIGILTFENAQGVPKEIYLYVKDDVYKIPVPKFIFKVVYHRDSASGIVFIMYNNPFVKTITDELEICPNVCKDNEWFLAKKSSKVESVGVSFCCTIDSFRKAIKDLPVEIPAFTTTGLLTERRRQNENFRETFESTHSL